MAEKIAELKKDIAELEELQKQAVRIKVRDILSIETRKLISDLIKLEEQQKSVSAAPASLANQATNKCYLVTLNNYAWDQSNKFVKFYVTLQNVQNLPAENITCSFTSKSLELNVKGLENKDYVLKINKLLNVINPEDSTWKVKTDMVIISAAKQEQKEWSHVTEIEKRASDSKKLAPESEKSDDPSEGLLNIMKNMYQQGDDELKRTITKAWTESMSKGPAF
ncbi:CS domain [Popillia japonica]|uniref:Calcyclin-binding protein n=1 Tax=Popillia japonica TaxID=7064 RepID=A0AAW1KI84_POPJA